MAQLNWLSMGACLYLRDPSPSLGDLMLQLGNRGNIVLYSEAQLCITSSIDSIFLQLFSEWLLPVDPTKTFPLGLVLQPKVGDLCGGCVCGKGVCVGRVVEWDQQMVSFPTSSLNCKYGGKVTWQGHHMSERCH